MKRKLTAGVVAITIAGTAVGAAAALKVLRTDMVGFIQVNAAQIATGGKLSGNQCTYTPTGATGQFGGMEIKASGRCAAVGTAELVTIPDFNLGVFDNIQSVQGSILQRDYVEVGKYVVIASPSGGGTSVVDGGSYEKVYAGAGSSSFIIRLTGVTSNQPIN